METTSYKVTFLNMYRSSQYFLNLTKFAVTWVKKGQSQGIFSRPIISKWHQQKKKGKEKKNKKGAKN